MRAIRKTKVRYDLKKLTAIEVRRIETSLRASAGRNDPSAAIKYTEMANDLQNLLAGPC